MYAVYLLFYAIEKQRRSGPLLTWRVRLTGLIWRNWFVAYCGPFSSVLFYVTLLEVYNY